MKPFFMSIIGLAILLTVTIIIFNSQEVRLTAKVIEDVETGEFRSVVITESGFDPMVIYANVGDRISFRNQYEYPQTVTSDSFGSTLIMPYEEYLLVITEKREYDYFSLINESFRGKIIVLN